MCPIMIALALGICESWQYNLVTVAAQQSGSIFFLQPFSYFCRSGEGAKFMGQFSGCLSFSKHIRRRLCLSLGEFALQLNLHAPNEGF